METKDIIEKLENEIWEQTRNGRDRIYVEVEDLKKLGCSTDENKTGRIYVDVNYLRAAIKRYKFKGDLKVDIDKCSTDNMTYREFIKEIKNIERGRD